MGDLFSDATSATLKKGLDCLGLRHRVISDNIANVETPGFTRSEVSFEAQLRQAVQSGGEQSIQEIQPEVVVDAASPARADGNNVSIDKEMAEMTKNTLRYESLIQLFNLKASMLRAAIEGRR